MGVFIIHGMGSPDVHFANTMIDELQTKISKEHVNSNDIYFHPGHWADVLESKEEALWRKLSRNNKMRWKDTREFVISAFGDAIAYQRIQSTKHKDVYTLVHEKIHEQLVKMRKELRDGLPDSHPDLPLVVIAHSLGCYMISNYIWDRQHGYEQDKFGGNDFLEMKSLTGMVTYGCNIPLFSLAYDTFECIAFPSPDAISFFPQSVTKLEFNSAVKWLNFYDPDDVLGYPLKPLSASYSNAVTEDIRINAGGLLSSWNPLSHIAYDSDNDFTKPVAKVIAEILKLLN